MSIESIGLRSAFRIGVLRLYAKSTRNHWSLVGEMSSKAVCKYVGLNVKEFSQMHLYARNANTEHCCAKPQV